MESERQGRIPESRRLGGLPELRRFPMTQRDVRDAVIWKKKKKVFLVALKANRISKKEKSSD